VLAESLGRNVERDLEKGTLQTLRKTVHRFANRENLMGMAVYDPKDTSLRSPTIWLQRWKRHRLSFSKL